MREQEGAKQQAAAPHALDRFVAAQEPVFRDARSELLNGRKQTHWMWFVFPQIAGLGSSYTAKKYAISSLDEARRYLAHPILGPRLIECTQIVNAIEGRTLDEIFGFPDNFKFRSSMTLFARAADDESVFREALDKYCAGEPDQATLEHL